VGDLIAELEANLDSLTKDYMKTQDEYTERKSRLEQELYDTEVDISNASDMINNVLFPYRDNLHNRMDQLKGFIEDNRGTLEKDTLQRNKAHAAFLERVNDHQGAISAVDECLSLLEGLINTGSFAEVSLQRL
jgi:hypothetical protein